jgi:hypothetical protein
LARLKAIHTGFIVVIFNPDGNLPYSALWQSYMEAAASS